MFMCVYTYTYIHIYGSRTISPRTISPGQYPPRTKPPWTKSPHSNIPPDNIPPDNSLVKHELVKKNKKKYSSVLNNPKTCESKKNYFLFQKLKCFKLCFRII